MDGIRGVLQTELLGMTVRDIAIAIGAAAAGFIVARIAGVILRKAGKKLPPASLRATLLDAMGRPLAASFRLAGIWVALNLLAPMYETELLDVRKLLGHLFVAGTVVLATWFGVRIIHALCEVWRLRAESTEGTFDDQLVPIVRKAAKTFLVITGAVMVLQNLEYDVGSLLAGLGIGGVAIGFASRDTIANFFGAIVIFVDRPFQIGDWVEIGDVEGTVEEVGVRVTLIRTFANSVITVPNAQLTTTPINNWSRMRKRRIKVTLGVTYDTTPDQMEQAVEKIREIIRADSRLHQDFFLVNFFEFGDSSLNIFLYLFTITTNWSEHMQVRQDFLLAVMRGLTQMGLEFAFPTRTVHVPELEASNQPPGAPRAMLRQTPA